MPVAHPGSCITHDLPDLFPHTRLVAMYPAIRTRGFVFLKRAFFKPLGRVLIQFPAGSAEAVARSVLSAAKNTDHRTDRPMFPCHSPGDLLPDIFFLHRPLSYLRNWTHGAQPIKKAGKSCSRLFCILSKTLFRVTPEKISTPYQIP